MVFKEGGMSWGLSVMVLKEGWSVMGVVCQGLQGGVSVMVLMDGWSVVEDVCHGHEGGMVCHGDGLSRPWRRGVSSSRFSLYIQPSQALWWSQSFPCRSLFPFVSQTHRAENTQ